MNYNLFDQFITLLSYNYMQLIKINNKMNIIITEVNDLPEDQHKLQSQTIENTIN